MTKDDQTIAVYEKRAQEYACRTKDRDEPGLDSFIAMLPEHAHVLDLGCGPGDASVRFLAASFSVDAIDATPAMVKAACQRGVTARIARFDQVDAQSTYDGICASYSLLHAPRADMPDCLARLHRAAKPNGRLHIGLKLGTGEIRDSLGRLYTYYTRDELFGLLKAAGFTPTDHQIDKGTGLDGTTYSGIWVHANA
ncbi:MAG: class I SAM-dependent methyltransferase [Paracoccaceae bacterium]